MLKPEKPQTIETPWQWDGWTEVGIAAGKALPLVLRTAWRLRDQLSSRVQASRVLPPHRAPEGGPCSLSSEGGCRGPTLPVCCSSVLQSRLLGFLGCMPAMHARPGTSLAVSCNNMLRPRVYQLKASPRFLGPSCLPTILHPLHRGLSFRMGCLQVGSPFREGSTEPGVMQARPGSTLRSSPYKSLVIG